MPPRQKFWSIFFVGVSFVSFYNQAKSVSQQMRNCVCKTQTATTGTRPPLVASQYMVAFHQICLHKAILIAVTNNVQFNSKVRKFAMNLYQVFFSLLSGTVENLFPLVYPITLEGRRGTTDKFATIPFHLVLFQAALVELAKSISAHSLILSSNGRHPCLTPTVVLNILLCCHSSGLHL